MVYRKRKCALKECGIEFTPRKKDQRFHSPRCSNRESQRLYRERQKRKREVTA
jgi:predicted RNA-binding Zn-ribbon protein involved in translation (DUF1610 family)